MRLSLQKRGRLGAQLAARRRLDRANRLTSHFIVIAHARSVFSRGAAPDRLTSATADALADCPDRRDRGCLLYMPDPASSEAQYPPERCMQRNYQPGTCQLAVHLPVLVVHEYLLAFQISPEQVQGRF